jgi:cation diffusion facilitator CzcD-associated flavoprotein CzcO
MEHFDVVVIGAGLSGIGAGCRLRMRCPGKRYVILEARNEIGGTWDLFRYPGVRSDSDMFTLGYPFRPWKEARAIADGPSILKYVRETAREFGVDRHIRFQECVESAAWSSEEGRWRVATRTAAGESVEYSCSFLYGCTGYYRYDAGYEPGFPGAERFRGQMVHPQRWPENLDYAGMKVVVIGSGATAVTLVPAMAETAAHVTMLQRSPTYILSLPNHDGVADVMRRWLPKRAAQRAVRWKNILISMGIYQLSRRAPERARKMFREGAVRSLPEGYEVDKHFNPRYQPWDQRLCLVPDSDLFKAISSGKASVVTDQIETFMEKGIRLKSGTELEADIIVTATGLQMLALGAVRLSVDGTAVSPGETFIYKGTMLSNVPNFAFCIGYTNASWTLRADLASTFVCRVLNYMDRHGYATCTPVCNGAGMEARPLLPLTSGYVQRAAGNLPRQASKKPWMIRQNYILDLMMMKLGRMEDGILRFGGRRNVRSRAKVEHELMTSSAADD